MPDDPAEATELSSVAHDHYFSRTPQTPDIDKSVRLVVDGQPYELATSTGVFSADRVDAGTSVLIQRAPRPPSTGVLLDLGTGYGPIAVALAVRSPAARVFAVDVNERALALVRRNAESLRMPNIQASTPDDVPPDVRFDAIYSNPPIRVGKAALHALLGTWISRLAPDALAYLVVHHNLGSDSLAAWLGSEGWRVRRLVSVRGYRVLAVSQTDVNDETSGGR